jgi:hypothetical protein
MKEYFSIFSNALKIDGVITSAKRGESRLDHIQFWLELIISPTMLGLALAALYLIITGG